MSPRDTIDFLHENETMRTEAHNSKVLELVNELLDGLFIPCEKLQRGVRNRKLLRELNINDKEPINWAKLFVNDIQIVKNNAYNVYLQPAIDGACPTLCSYLRNRMEEAGYFVNIKMVW
jgi:hypothetical protein